MAKCKIKVRIVDANPESSTFGETIKSSIVDGTRKGAKYYFPVPEFESDSNRYKVLFEVLDFKFDKE